MSPKPITANTLFYGDNLPILRDYIADESVDLVCLDPPFNSKRDYNLLFKTPKGHSSEAQITAFEDSWHWGEQAEHEYAEILKQPNTAAAEMIQALRRFLRENDMLAYLVMMGNRLLELHRVLKPTGSLYLHCDPTASHYIKILLDAIFQPGHFRSEVMWKRTYSHNDPKNYGNILDSIFYYTKSQQFTWNKIHTPYTQEYIDKYYRHTDSDGRRYQLVSLRSPHPRKNLQYDYKGYKPHPNGWAVSLEVMQKLDAEGRLHFPNNPDGAIREKYYLDEMPGVPLQSLWDDIGPISAQAQERLGYPTQKPLALLERIVNASSNPGDVVLDPFCGCGTTVHAAQKLGRQWIGIDITPLAISLIEKRLKEAFPNLHFQVEGLPKDLDGAQRLASQQDKYPFQWWACALVDAQPYQGKKKGADGGIDGLIYFQDDKGAAKKIVVSVKGGESVGVSQIRDLAHVVDREKAAIGLFVTLTPPTRPMKVEAVSAGHYHSAHFGDYDKIQILTIEGLLNGSESPHYPDLSRGGASFKLARVEQEQAQQGGLL